MIAKLQLLCIIAVGFINIAPLIGIISAKKLEALYGIAVNEPNLQILMQHRALLFGLIGGFLLYSAIKPVLQIPALSMALISMAGFIAIALKIGSYNADINKIILVDVVGIVLAIIALALHFLPVGSTDSVT